MTRSLPTNFFHKPIETISPASIVHQALPPTRISSPYFRLYPRLPRIAFIRSRSLSLSLSLFLLALSSNGLSMLKRGPFVRVSKTSLLQSGSSAYIRSACCFSISLSLSSTAPPEARSAHFSTQPAIRHFFKVPAYSRRADPPGKIPAVGHSQSHFAKRRRRRRRRCWH